MIVVLTILLLLSSFFLYAKYQMSWKRTSIAVYENDENGYRIVFEEIGEAFTFGPSHVRITLKDEKGKEVNFVDTHISNDGARLYEENAQVLWEDDKVQITLIGCEQEDEIIEFDY